MSPVAQVLTNPALLQYLTSIGAGGTYAINKDKIDRFAGSFRFPWPGRESAEERWLRTGSFDEPSTAEVITAAPGATGSELDAKTIVTPAGALVHQPAGKLVGGGNEGNGGDDDKRYWQNARWSAIGELVDKFTRGVDGNDEVDPYEAGKIEREENEWGPNGQPSASEQKRIYDQSDWRNSQRYANSPASRSGVFTEEMLGRQKQLNDDFKAAQRSRTMEEFVRQYPQSQTAKEYAIRKRIPSSLDMEF